MSLFFRIIFTFLFLLPNLKAEDLKDCEWDNRDGVPCLTISKTSNTSAYNNGNVLKLLPVVNGGGEYVNFSNSDSVFKDGSDTSVDVSSGGVDTAHPEFSRYTGQILYVENRGAVSRAADQIEDIKLIIEM